MKEIKYKHIKKYRDKISTQLGIPLSTAKSRLDRIIIFNLVEKLGLNSCYRCNGAMSIDDISVEHKTPWINEDNAMELYFDIENISFSHNLCNSSARRYNNTIAWNKGKITHGTSGYRTGCRCDICKKKYSEARKAKYLKNKT